MTMTIATWSNLDGHGPLGFGRGQADRSNTFRRSTPLPTLTRVVVSSGPRKRPGSAVTLGAPVGGVGYELLLSLA